MMQQVTTTAPPMARYDSRLRRKAMKAGRADYVSARPCPRHRITVRDLKGACLDCLDESRSRSQAKR
jgi:hypothetical protein